MRLQEPSASFCGVLNELRIKTLIKTLFLLLNLVNKVSESTNKGVNQHPKDITQTQQQRPKSPTIPQTWRASK